MDIIWLRATFTVICKVDDFTERAQCILPKGIDPQASIDLIEWMKKHVCEHLQKHSVDCTFTLVTTLDELAVHCCRDVYKVEFEEPPKLFSTHLRVLLN